MKLPEIAALSPSRAWAAGLLSALVLSWIASRVPLTFALAVAALAFCALTVRPRAFFGSGALLGVAPFITWGILDGLMKCVGFNRAGGFCEADPTSQVTIAVIVYVAAVAATFVALRGIGTGDRPG